MSITSSSATVPLKAIEMDQLREKLEPRLMDNNYQCRLESIGDSEMIMQVARRPAYRTVVTIERLRHRPLEVVVQVDYGQVDEIKDVIRISRTGSTEGDSWINSRWIWILLIIGGLIAGIVSVLRNLIDNVVNDVDTGLDRGQQIILVVVLTLLIILFWVYGVPLLLRQKRRTLQHFDLALLQLLTQRIREVNQELVASDVVRCWSCFKELEQERSTCPHCGEEQQPV